MTYIAGQAGITKKQAADAYEALTGLVAAHLKSKKAFTFPGLAKCVVNRKPATKPVKVLILSQVNLLSLKQNLHVM